MGECRLPTEAEWEYACRAGTTTPFYTGHNLTTFQANYKNKWNKTIPVGSFMPNAWDLYDMYGNVFEWCSDWFDFYPTTAQTNPTGPSSGTHRVCRGGCWGSGEHYTRSAARISNIPECRGNALGFRLASPK